MKYLKNKIKNFNKNIHRMAIHLKEYLGLNRILLSTFPVLSIILISVITLQYFNIKWGIVIY